MKIFLSTEFYDDCILLRLHYLIKSINFSILSYKKNFNSKAGMEKDMKIPGKWQLSGEFILICGFNMSKHHLQSIWKYLSVNPCIV